MLRITRHSVLNLVINGLPSIRPAGAVGLGTIGLDGFKPCYKWITFNTFSWKLLERLD